MRRVLTALRSGRGLRSFAAMTLAWMLLVILEGAVVRATGSGAGCGDHWPLCNGQILPHHPRLATIIEFTHRSMTGICSGLTFSLVAWVFFAEEAGSFLRKAAAWSGILLLTEALLGAILVKGHFVEHNTSGLRVLVQGVHFTNTLLLLAALSLVWWGQPTYPETRRKPQPPSRALALAALAGVILTGATGSVAALADTLFPAPNLRTALLADFAAGSPLLLHMRVLHPLASTLALCFILVLAWRSRPPLRRALVLLLGCQFILGIADVLALAPLSLQVLHLLGADLLWIALVIAASEAFPVRSPLRLHSFARPSTATA